MALAFKCEKGHSYVAPDILPDDWPKGCPVCPECRKEWELRNLLLQQQEAYYAATERKNLVILQGGPATGKTYAALHAAVEKCRATPDYTVFYFAPGYEIIHAFDTYQEHSVWGRGHHPEREWEFKNGSVIVFVFSPERYVGALTDWLIVDCNGQIPLAALPLLRGVMRVTIILGEDWEVVKMPEVKNPYLDESALDVPVEGGLEAKSEAAVGED